VVLGVPSDSPIDGPGVASGVVSSRGPVGPPSRDTKNEKQKQVTRNECFLFFFLGSLMMCGEPVFTTTIRNEYFIVS